MMKMSDFDTISAKVEDLRTLYEHRDKLRIAHEHPDNENIPRLICDAPDFALVLPLSPDIFRAISHYIEIKISEAKTALENLGVET